jgi:hypothetical protein
LRRARLQFAFLVCAAAFVSAGARAQSIKVAKKKPGTLGGEVVNAKGAPVAGAQILWQAADGETPHVLHSDAQGKFYVGVLRTGSYARMQTEPGPSGSTTSWCVPATTPM